MSTRKNSLLFKIKLLNENVEYNVNNFIDLFLEGSIFASYLDEIYGIATHNYVLKIYNVTFKENTPKSIIEDIYDTFKDPKEITNNDNMDLTIQVNRPPGYKQLITLYPMPFDINTETLNEITRNWGNLKHHEFGKHKKCPLIHNPYLHLYLENFKRKSTPDSINFRGRFISVNIDGETPKLRCNYCKETSHLLEDCPKKTSYNNQEKENTILNNHKPPKQSYAKKVTSTPKTVETPLLHPMTKLKLTKKNIEKTIQNFPSLEQIIPSPDCTKAQNPKLNSSSLKTSQEDVINSFDDIQHSKTSQPIETKDEDPQTPMLFKDPDSQKRKHSPSPQSSSMSIDLKPRKKRTNSKEKKRENSL